MSDFEQPQLAIGRASVVAVATDCSKGEPIRVAVQGLERSADIKSKYTEFYVFSLNFL